MAMSSGGGDYNSEINVTPLVDVMLVLLIIFMITAPMMTTGVDVDLPEANAPAINDPKGKVILSIDREEQLYLGGKKIKWADLKNMVALNERIKRERELYVEAYEALPYEVVLTAMALAREGGVLKVQLLADPQSQIDPGVLDGDKKGKRRGKAGSQE
jgi:biopolymer transport protein TolR